MAKEKGKKKSGGWLWGVLLVLALAVMVYSGWQLFQIYRGYRQGEEEYDELASLSADLKAEAYSRPEDGTEERSESEEGGEPEFDAEANARWFAELQALNPDIVGWIRVDGTVIDYPVMHTDNNDYYLTHTYQGTKNSSGSIFLETANAGDFEDYHTIIYGHNMKNGSMFASLHSYADPAYYQEHAWITIDTPAGPRRYQIFSCHTVNAEDELYRIGFVPGEEYTRFVNRLKELSDYDTGVEVSGEDSVITLSTCKGNGSLRYVVHAKLTAE
jgi:sortase B